MNATRLQDSSDGSRTIEIRCDEIPYHRLLKFFRSLQGCVLSETSINPLNDDAHANISFKGNLFELTTPFSDYWISSASDCPADVFEELFSHLLQHKVKWWEKIF